MKEKCFRCGRSLNKPHKYANNFYGSVCLKKIQIEDNIQIVKENIHIKKSLKSCENENQLGFFFGGFLIGGSANAQ